MDIRIDSSAVLKTLRTAQARLVAHMHVVLTSVPGLLYTFFLFTKSDMKTILFPITVFGTVAAPSTAKYRRLPHTLGWVWMHLLQFCISNQSLSEGEDLANKPWRPLPAKRMSLATMLRIRWSLLPTCLALSSLYHGARWPSLALSVGIFLHNEMYLDSHWATRNLCNALGYAAFNAGATYVACDECSLDGRIFLSQLMGSLIVLTTIHSQDFEDVEGDRIQGRRTLPLVFPRASRMIMVALLPAWSIFLSLYWRSGPLYCVGLLGLGFALAARYHLLQSRKSDRISYILYNVWLSMAQVMAFTPTPNVVT